jgi:hypothetical protein
MYRIRRFGVIQTATIVAVIYVLVIAIFAIPFAFLVFAYSPSNSAAFAVSVLVGGLLAALLYAAIGWIFTAIACLLYNLAAGWTGGIVVQVEPVGPPAAPPNWGPPGMPSPPTLPPAG